MSEQRIISASYGNDSIAMIQWAIENHISVAAVAYCDTGWAAPHWQQRVEKGEAFARKHGIETVRCPSIGMEELVRIKKGFPSNQHQFCTAHLKGLPFLNWIENFDPHCKAVVMIGKRRAESENRKNTPEFIDASEYHGGRRIWHPLYLHSDAERNALLDRAGFPTLPHRSRECSPCVNSNRADFLALTPGEVERVNDLEVAIGKPMFRAKRFGALGIHGVIRWAADGRKRGSIEDEENECASLFGCGT